MSYNGKCMNATSNQFGDHSETLFDEKPPAPPVRLSSAAMSATPNSSIPVDMRPLPKAPEDEKKLLKKSKLRGSIKRSNDGGSNSVKNSSNGTNGSGGSNFYYRKDNEKPVISPPTNFEHTMHVGFDPSTGEFTGMPKTWYVMLKNSNISKTEQKKNPQAVIEVLKWYESKDKDKGFKYMTMGMLHPSPSPIYSLPILHSFFILFQLVNLFRQLH